MEPIAYTLTTDGEMRPIYEENGRQFVIDDDGDQVYGVLIPIKKSGPISIVKAGPLRPVGAVVGRGAHRWRSSARGSKRGVAMGRG